MAEESNEITQLAEKLGKLVAAHPAVAKYQQAQKAVAEDPDASRLLQDFDRTIEALSRQEASGMPVTEAQRQQLEVVQSRIVSHIKVKALNLAQVEFVDVLRKVSQTWQKPLQELTGGGGSRGGASPASRLVTGM